MYFNGKERCFKVKLRLLSVRTVKTFAIKSKNCAIEIWVFQL